MPARKLDAADVSLPTFDPGPAADGDISPFDLSSHTRARDALEFGLTVDDPGFNIFVLGEDRSGRMSATLDYLNEHAASRPAPHDWLYLNNFARPHKPVAYRLPTGEGRNFRQRMTALIPALREALKKAFESPDFAADMQQLTDRVQNAIGQEFAQLQALAKEHRIHVQQSPQGLQLTPLSDAGEPVPYEDLTEEQKEAIGASIDALRAPIRDFNISAARQSAAMAEAIVDLRRQTAADAVSPLIDEFAQAFERLAGISRWIVELREDLLDHLNLLLPPGDTPPPFGHRAEDRYAVNLIVDNGDLTHQPVIVEPNPTYENLFGYIEYHSANGVMETNFSMVRSGALHRANGGILVLRADALAREPYAWEALKGALRDKEIRIEERPRLGSLPMVSAPKPKPMPLDLKVVIVGAPRLFYAFFTLDPDFKTYFKVKADIDADLEITERNLAVYRGLIAKAAKRFAERGCEDGAVDYLLGQSARWSGSRDKLSASFELIEDALAEAGVIADAENAACLTGEHIARALEERQRRNARVEDRAQEEIDRGTIMIDTSGHVIGQINGLTVSSTGDHNFGRPARVTARTFAGELGIINIERHAMLAGPIQVKGAYEIEGFLNGRFAQTFPLSFSASITFEQNYGGVDGDSASMAELIAILSSLADVPIRQDIAITGSVNQWGRAQAIGGANEKIEGFYRTCEAQGLTGDQGVVIPRANESHLVLRPTVARAVADGKFHVWSMETVEDAIELLTGVPAGTPGGDGMYPPDTVCGRAWEKLERYDRALSARAAVRRGNA